MRGLWSRGGRVRSLRQAFRIPTSCTDTGITWCAIAGIDTVCIQRRTGHDDINTTLGYVKQAEDLGGRLGVLDHRDPHRLNECANDPSKNINRSCYLQWQSRETDPRPLAPVAKNEEEKARQYEQM